MVYKAIVVGAGGFWGGTWATSILRQNPDWEPVAYVDTDENALKFSALVYHFPEERCFTDIEKAVEKVQADAAIVAVPTWFHHVVTLKALKAGLHVICEKPFSNSMENAKMMVAEAEKQKLKLMVDENFRWVEGALTTKKLLENDFVGKLDHVVLNFSAKFYDYGGWRWENEDVNLREHFAHNADTTRYLTGLEAVSVWGVRWKPEHSWVPGPGSNVLFFEMENGVKFTYIGDSQSAMPYPHPLSEGYRIECANATILANFMDLKGIPEFLVPNPKFNNIKVFTRKPVGMFEPELIHMLNTGRFGVLNDFTEAIREDKEPMCSGKEDLGTMAMMYAAIDACHTGEKKLIKDYL